MLRKKNAQVGLVVFRWLCVLFLVNQMPLKAALVFCRIVSTVSSDWQFSIIGRGGRGMLNLLHCEGSIRGKGVSIDVEELVARIQAVSADSVLGRDGVAELVSSGGGYIELDVVSDSGRLVVDRIRLPLKRDCASSFPYELIVMLSSGLKGTVMEVDFRSIEGLVGIGSPAFFLGDQKVIRVLYVKTGLEWIRGNAGGVNGTIIDLSRGPLMDADLDALRQLVAYSEERGARVRVQEDVKDFLAASGVPVGSVDSVPKRMSPFLLNAESFRLDVRAGRE